MLKKTLLFKLVLVFISLMPSAVWGQVLPNFRQLQQRFDSNELNRNFTRQLGNAIQVQLNNPRMDNSCGVTSLSLCLTFRENRQHPVTGLKIKIRTARNRSYQLITNTRGRSVFNTINIQDFPLQVNIPIIIYHRVINNPINLINENQTIINLLNVCSCDRNMHALLIKRLIKLCGNEIVKLNLTRPLQTGSNQLSPLHLKVSLSLGPTPIQGTCLPVFINKNHKNLQKWLKTNNIGEAIFDSLSFDDFPLTIDIPAISYHDVINQPKLSAQYREQLNEEQKKILIRTRQLFSHANHCYQNSRFKEAVNIYSKIIKMNQGNASVFNSRGNAYYASGNIDNAIQDFVQAIQIDPDYDKAHYNLGNIYFINKDNANALRELNLAIKHNPRNGLYYYTRAGIYRNMKRRDDALNDFNRAVELNPDLWEAFFDRGGLFYMQEMYEKAVSDWSMVLELRPENFKAYFYRANAYLNMRQEEQACSDFHEACQLGYQNACSQYAELSCH